MTLPSDCQIETATASDAEAIRAIYRPYVENSAISFEEELPSITEIQKRMQGEGGRYPWLIARDANRQILGYAYASQYRSRAAYRWSVETSVYVLKGMQRKGIARTLYEHLFKELRQRGFVHAIAVIAVPNPPSIEFHEAFGFKRLCRFPQAGFKLGQWVDVEWWWLPLRTPEANPRSPQGF